ncbi:MAG TPA: 16S rRNA (cytidine(1402)-2'-O)-methyltransferase, partial [Spirochaetia bacterium]|nr:16S rRNA (cytidine(1402)-2'-O)-methyltransferase [Spirochaetia bacterium]
DITQRALATLEKADYVACEDTRQTLKLLTRYQLKKKLVSHYAYNEELSSRKILSLLEEGAAVALVSDSGTPCLSDPGTQIVRLARENGHQVVPIPGPSALTALLSVSGYGAKGTLFEGFLSPKKGRRKKRLRELLESGFGFVLYESPFRIVALLTDLADLAPERKLVIGREMTKLHEEFFQGNAKELLTGLQEKPTIKGEFSVFVANG